MHSAFAEWNAAVGRGLEALGTAEFPRALEAAIRAAVPFDIFMVFAYSGPENPICLAHNMDGGRAETVIEAYARGPYLLDPFYSAAIGHEPAGVIRLKSLAPDLFYTSEYFKQHYERTCIRDEVGFLMRPAPGLAIVVSVTRPIDGPAFSARDMQTIRAIEPVVRRLGESHWRDIGQRFAPGRRNGAKAGPIDRALDAMAVGHLTPREIEITALVLRGHSNASIADLLKISAGTVKIHRRNIYQKLQIGSQADLFARFIAHLATVS